MSWIATYSSTEITICVSIMYSQKMCIYMADNLHIFWWLRINPNETVLNISAGKVTSETCIQLLFSWALYHLCDSNNTFVFLLTGIQGFFTYIDDNGDAEGNYTLLCRQEHESQYGNYSMLPVGHFEIGSLGAQLPVCTLFQNLYTAQWEGDGDVGSASYEQALLPPCPTKRALSYRNCQRSTHSISKWMFRNF